MGAVTGESFSLARPSDSARTSPVVSPPAPSLARPEHVFPTLTPESRLPDALRLFTHHALNRIPLIRDTAGRELMGTVSKQRVLQEASGLF